MSRTIKILPAILLVILFTSVTALFAQQEVTIRVQVNRTAYGTYPTKLHQFQSTPGLVTVTITNRTNNPYSVYLNGALTGDNGVRVTTAQQYQPGTIALQPFETKILNSAEAGSLFDPNRLVYSSGNTSIRSTVFGEQGLPEGTYQVCVRAFNAANRQPLSEEDPLGCSNIFSITTLEPPVILNPFDDSKVKADPVQNIPIRWTTPPGAPVSTEYRVRIVELFTNRNPNDAILSTASPFFETTVRGTPMLFYSMQYPLLQVGRKYALIVIASDPSGFATFRNSGRSEVVQFIYGASPTDDASGDGVQAVETDHATNKLRGRLVWTFKKTEKPSHSLHLPTLLSVATTPAPNVVDAYAGSNFSLQTAATPLVKFNPLSAISTDNTLQQVSGSSNNFMKVTLKPDFTTATVLPVDIVSASHSSSTECTYDDIVVDSAPERYGLSSVKFTLRAVRSLPGATSSSSLLATGQTDKEGSFELEFLHPSYNSISGVTHLLLSVQTNDFENTSFKIPSDVINKATTADIGDLLLLAKTYRFFAKASFPKTDDESAGSYEYRIYRDAADVEERPWLMHEGRAKGARASVEIVDGRKVIEVATQEITARRNTGNDLIVSIPVDAHGVGRIFLGGKLYVKIIPASSSFYNVLSTVSTYNVSLPSGRILQAKATYKLSTKPSHIAGKVTLVMDGQGSIPVAGATVRVLYKKEDVVPGNTSTILSSPNELLKANTNQYLKSWTDYNTSDPGSNPLELVSYGLTDLVSAPPVLVEQKPGSNKLNAQLVVSNISLESLVNPVPADSRAVTGTTDEVGNYYIGNLPLLKPGKNFLVQVISVPNEFRTFVVRPQAGGPHPVPITLGKGVSRVVNFAVDADVADVVGRVVDAEGKPLINCRVALRGNILSQTGPDGIFQFKLYPGDHTLSLEKEGYATGKARVSIPQLTGNNDDETSHRTEWASMTAVQKQTATLIRISQSPTVQASVSRGNQFNPIMFGIAADNKTGFSTAATEFNASLAVAFGLAVDPQTPQYEMPRKFAVDVKDIGYLKTLTGKIRFRLLSEQSGERVTGATIQLFDTANVSDGNGEWYYEGFGGSTTVTVIPPAGTTFVAVKKLLNIPENGTEQTITISLKTGVRVTGTVRSEGQVVPGALIWVDENDFTKATSDNDGNYSIVTTPEEHVISARKQGYVGQDLTRTTTSPGTIVDFDLKGSQGKNYNRLLGFDIELSSVEKVGNQEKWSGSFVHLKSVDNNTFQIDSELRVDFSAVLVTFDAQGNAIPANNIVKTDVTSIPVKLFGYLPGRIETNDAITFTRSSTGLGQLSGTIRADFNAIQGYRGWSISEVVPLFLAKLNGTAPDKLIVFSSAGPAPVADAKYKLIPTSTSKPAGKLYGFAISINNETVIDKDGIELSGTIATPVSGPIKAAQFNIDRLAFNRSLAVSGVQIRNTDLPALEIAGWKAGISTLIFHEDGFKLGGTVSLQIPRSREAKIDFSDLSIAPTGIFGGSFVIPESGVDIISVANLNTNGTALTFGRVGNSSVYRIGGRASLKVNVDITDKPFNVPLFEVMTNGDFTVQVPANYSTTIGPFGFSIGNIYINTKDNTPFIGIQGGFKVDFHFLKFEMADIKVRSSSGGPTYALEKLGVKLDVPVVTTQAFVTLKKDGFEGTGSLNIPGTPIGADANFKYFKRAGGIELGANFFTNLPPLPIGVLVTLDGIGGGFEYKSGGANGGFAVDVRGKLSFVGTGPVVAVNPLGLTVSSAGILHGYGDVVVGTYLNTGKANVVFNGPDRTFSIQIEAKMEPLEGLVSQSVNGALIISAKPNDEFAFLGCAVNVQLLGLIDNHGEMAVGIRVKNPKTRGDLISYYFSYAPEDYMQQRFSGVYINVSAQLGIPKNKPLEFDLYVASAKIWCSTAFHASLLLNLEEMAYRMRFGGKFDAGIEGCVVDIACLGVSAGLCYTVEGSRNASQGWFFGATATGNASFMAGLGAGNCKPGCNEIRTLYHGCAGGAFRVCGAASLDFSFSQNKGLAFKARAGSGGEACF